MDIKKLAPSDGVSKVDGKVMTSAASKLGFLGEGATSGQALKLRAEGDVGSYTTPSLGVGSGVEKQTLGWTSPNAPAVVPAATAPAASSVASAPAASSTTSASASSASTSSGSNASSGSSSSTGSTGSTYDDPALADKINEQSTKWVKESQYKTPKRNCAHPAQQIAAKTGLKPETAEKAVKMMHFSTTKDDAQTIAMALATLANEKPPNKQDQADAKNAIDRMYSDRDVMNGDGSGAEKAGDDYQSAVAVLDGLGTKLTGGSTSTSSASQFDTTSAVAVNSWK